MTALIRSTTAQLGVCVLGAWLVSAGVASAQSGESSWNIEGGVGWDISLSGDFLAAGIGTLNGLPTIIQPQSFGDVYGNGVQWKFSGGYMVDEINEVRAQFSYQRAGSDVVSLGTVGGTDLIGTFDDYKAWSVEAGYRHYFAKRRERLRPYGGGTLGVSIINEIDGAFAAPQAGITRLATDFYDGTAALTFGVNGGVLYGLNEQIDLNAQVGFRFNSGLSQIDGLAGTDLEDINDKSARWTMPISVGIRFNF
jgi:Outer membrane protein beta-barrel domain